jgi:hypothetical protein
MATIHIASDLSYLFPATARTATVLCGKLCGEVFATDEFVGVAGSLNPSCAPCVGCLAVQGAMQV